LDNYQINSPLI